MAPRNGGSIESPDLTGHAGAPGRGAFMILYLKIEDDRIASAKYHTVGCGPTIASGSMLTEMIKGKSIAECRELTVDDLIEALDGMPPDKLHCPALAIGCSRMRWRSGPIYRMALGEKFRRGSTVHRCTQSMCGDRRAEAEGESGTVRRCHRWTQMKRMKQGSKPPIGNSRDGSEPDKHG